jgi:hypothetical protein
LSLQRSKLDFRVVASAQHCYWDDVYRCFYAFLHSIKNAQLVVPLFCSFAASFGYCIPSAIVLVLAYSVLKQFTRRFQSQAS